MIPSTKDIFNFILDTIQTNIILFYVCLTVAVFLFFLSYYMIKKRKLELLKKENKRTEAEYLVKLEIERKAKKDAEKLALEQKQRIQKEKESKEKAELKVKEVTTSPKNIYDFVAISVELNKVCVRGIQDDFLAIKTNNEWRKGYPEFDDLMDYYAEVKDLTDIEKYSLEARGSIKEQTEIKAKIIEINEEEKKEEKVGNSKRKTSNHYIDTNEVLINVIISSPEPSASVPKRIGYLPNDKFEQTEPYKYAVVKMPQKNSLIKFPRKGRSDKKGYKEDDFFVHLNKHFKIFFDVLNDRHIPNVNGRPYEPDFVLSNEKENKNIFINIEIDEPYDGWLRTPTHCVNENNLRDEFFTKRGWIVIRFAEKQIHLEPQKCCSYIAKVIHSIDSTFNSDLLNETNLNEITQWDNLQANKWASQRYREEYLGIDNFGRRPNIITEYDITESAIDKAVENEIPKQKNKSKLEKGSLAIKNKHYRDKRIQFDPIEHRYFIDENPDTISVTQLIDKFFPEFDSLYWSRKKAIDRLFSLGQEQSEENILAMQIIILKEWDDRRIDAANKGTALHEEIENYYKGSNHNSNTVEFQQFLTFKQRYNRMIPFRSEWRIFDEDLLVAGTIDMVYKKEDGSLYMFDWKRSEKVVRSDGSINNNTFQFAFGELGHLGDNSYNKYCLQLNIYKAILEKRYEKNISSMNLLVMHETYNRYHHIPIPNMDKEVNYILTYALLIK